jgi:tetratricopeptide (TPR) repeat protein
MSAIMVCHVRRKWLSSLLLLVAWATVAFSQDSAPPPSASGDSAEVHLGRGYDALKLDNYDEAARQFRAALEIDPTLVLKARFPLAVALFEMHRSAEARQEFEAVRREAGDHPNVLYYLGRLDVEDRNFDDAIRNLQKAAAKPPFPDTAYYLGFAYFRKDDLASAEKWLKEAETRDPRDSRIPYQLSAVYRKQGRAEEAQKELARSTELRQRDTEESTLKGECADRLKRGLREEVHKICDQLYDPDDAKKLSALGTLYGQYGDPQSALKPLLRAAELEPQSPQMQYNLAFAYYQLNRFEEARAPLARALQRWPDLFPLNALYGAVLVKLGDTRAAYDVLRHAQKLNPQDGSTGDLLYLTTLDLARKAAAAKHDSDALHYFEEAAQLRPREPVPHREMAEIYARQGSTAKAEAEQQEAARLSRLVNN